jgi:hypothetical protein
VQCSHGRQFAHTTTDFVVRMITSAVTTHVVFVAHYHLHATTTFLSNPIFSVEYLPTQGMSRAFCEGSDGWAQVGSLQASPKITFTIVNVRTLIGLCERSRQRGSLFFQIKETGVEHVSCDVLVLGSGGAGLRAAISAREMGLEVLVVSEAAGASHCKWRRGLVSSN